MSALLPQPGGFEQRASATFAAVSHRAEALAGAAALGLPPDVRLRDRGQQGDKHADAGEDVDDREDLRPGGGRGEISEAHSRQDTTQK